MIKTAAYQEGYEAGVKLALAEAGIIKQAGYWYNPVWNEDDPRPWTEILKQNLASGTAGIAAGAGAALPVGVGTRKLLEHLGKSPRAQYLGAGLAGLGAFLGAGYPVSKTVFDAMED